MYHKKARLKQPVDFKEPGKPQLYTSRKGTRVHVDRHEFDEGMYVVWLTPRKYALLNSDQLIDKIEFD